jgi:hypothetical protein
VVTYAPAYQQLTLLSQNKLDGTFQNRTIKYQNSLFAKPQFSSQHNGNGQQQAIQPTFTIQQPIQTDEPQQKIACAVPTNINSTNENVLTAIMVKRGSCQFGILHTHIYK